MAGSRVYDAYIFVLRQTNNFIAAQKIFNEAEKRNLADVGVYESYVDVLVQTGKIRQAVELISDDYPRPINAKSGEGIYNFQEFDFGIALITTHLIFEQAYPYEQITIIVGKKTHSVNENFARRAVELFVARSQGLVEIIENDDPERLELRLLTEYNPDLFLNTWLSYLNNPAQGESHWNLAQETSLTSQNEEPQNRTEENKSIENQSLQVQIIHEKLIPQHISDYVHPGLQWQKIGGDGHCLYRAVTLYLTNGEDVISLRQIVGANLEHNIDQYRGFIPMGDGRSVEEYINDLTHTNAWAGDLEINILMRLLDRPIAVIGPEGTIRNIEAVRQYNERDPIFVYFDDHVHYDAFILLPGFDGRAVLNELLQRSSQEEVGTEAPKRPGAKNTTSKNREAIGEVRVNTATPVLQEEGRQYEEDITHKLFSLQINTELDSAIKLESVSNIFTLGASPASNMLSKIQ